MLKEKFTAIAEKPAVQKDEVLRVYRLMEAAQRSAEQNIVIKEKL